MAVLAGAAWIPGLLAPAGPVRDAGYAPAGSGAGPTAGSDPARAAPLAEPAPTPPGAARDVPVGEAGPRPLRPVLRLVLVDERGAPAVGRFEVEYRRASPRPGGSPALGVTRIDLDGPDVAIDVADFGSYRVWVRGAGLVGDGSAMARLGPDDPAVRFELQRTVQVRGSVVDARAAPLEGVDVEALVRRGGTVVGRVASRSDAAGWFTLDLPPGTHARVFVGDAGRPWVPPIEIDAGLGAQVLDPIRVELHEAEFVVVLADGAPAAGARLDGTGLDGGRFSVTTDAGGRVRVARLARGRWRVNAALASHGRESRAVEIPLARDEPVLLVLPR